MKFKRSLDAAKAILRHKIIAVSVYLKKQEKSQINLMYRKEGKNK